MLLLKTRNIEEIQKIHVTGARLSHRLCSVTAQSKVKHTNRSCEMTSRTNPHEGLRKEHKVRYLWWLIGSHLEYRLFFPRHLHANFKCVWWDRMEAWMTHKQSFQYVIKYYSVAYFRFSSVCLSTGFLLVTSLRPPYISDNFWTVQK